MQFFLGTLSAIIPGKFDSRPTKKGKGVTDLIKIDGLVGKASKLDISLYIHILVETRFALNN